MKILFFCFLCVCLCLCLVCCTQDQGHQIGSKSDGAEPSSSHVVVSGVKQASSLLVLSLVAKETDGVRRLRRSTSVYGINFKALGLGELHAKPGFEKSGSDWDDELLILRREVAKHKDVEDLLILVVDGFNTIFQADEEEILEVFSHFRTNVVFGGHTECRPEQFKEASPEYDEKYKYLNADNFAGYAPYLHRLLTYEKTPGEDFQTHFQRLYTNPDIREELLIEVDPTADLIFNIDKQPHDNFLFNAGKDDTQIRVDGFYTDPPVLHSISPSGNSILSNIGNYVAKSRSYFSCLVCSEGKIELEERKESAYPKVLLGVFVYGRTTRLSRTLKMISRMTYPRKRIVLHVYNMVPEHEKVITGWLNWVKSKYISVKYIASTGSSSDTDTFSSQGEAKHLAISDCLRVNCDLFFNVESEVQIDNPDTLSLLVSYNRTILAPLMIHSSISTWATFWGDVDGHYYKRAFNYMGILRGDLTGIWNVPYVYGVYVLWRSAMENPLAPLNFINYNKKSYDQNVVFPIHNRINQLFMYVVNLEKYGHLTDTNSDDNDDKEEEFVLEEDDFLAEDERITKKNKRKNTRLTNLDDVDDVYPITKVISEWENKYLHRDYHDVLHDNEDFDIQICDGVFHFPVFTEAFCQNIINLTSRFEENHDGSSHLDPSLRSVAMKMGLKVAVPMKAIDDEKQWQSLVETYIFPLLPRVSMESYGNKEITTNFVAKYERSPYPYFLNFEPSMYTVRITLNQVGKDYKGSSWKFSAQNCVPTPAKPGWAIIYPGRLQTTEASLHVTDGYKYEIIAFINPS